MKIELTGEEKIELEKRHRTERDGRIRDRIKAVLLKSEGWKDAGIAQALRIHTETVAVHLSDWVTEQKVKPENGGSIGKLNEEQARELMQHVAEHCYTRTADICGIVEKKWDISFSISGMTKWLQAHDFRYKQPKALPKGNALLQEEFIDHYLKLLDQTQSDTPIVFMDSVHPTMATKLSCGWIKKGHSKAIPQTASRTRVNITGAIELKTMALQTHTTETVNGESTAAFFEQLIKAYPTAQKVHVILDQAGYHRSEVTKKAAKDHRIELHYLPPYSPNLNPIERLWKVMNEHTRNNRYFATANEFRQTLNHFFTETYKKIKESLRSRITDNFQTIHPVS